MRRNKAIALLCALALALSVFVPLSTASAAAPMPVVPFATNRIATPGGNLKWDVPVTYTYVQPKMDIVYVIDTTGSMDDHKDTVANSVAAFNSELSSKGATDIYWGAAFFGDISDDLDWYGMRLPLGSYSLTDVATAISNLDSTWGGTTAEEDSLAAFMKAVAETPWRPDAQHVIVLITDAATKVRPTMTFGGYPGTYAGSLALATEKSIVTCFMTRARTPLTDWANVLGVSEYLWNNGPELNSQLEKAVISPSSGTDSFEYEAKVISTTYVSDGTASSDITTRINPASFTIDSANRDDKFEIETIGALPPARFNEDTVVEIGFFIDGARVDSLTQKVYYRVNQASVIYDANTTDLTSTVPGTVAYLEDTVVTVEPALTREGYTFTEWNTQADGLGTTYLPDDKFRIGTADVYLYAQWQPNTHIVTYYPNTTDTTSPVTPAASYYYGDPVTIEPALTRTGYTFVTWNTKSDRSGTDVPPAAAFNMPDYDIDLYAIWVKGSPNTSDSSNTAIYLTIAFASLAMLGATAFLARKKVLDI